MPVVEVEYMAQCHDCDYEWEYGGELNRATCPNCGAKVVVGGDE